MSELLDRCVTPDQLHQWIVDHVGIDVPRRSVCPHHGAPFDYLLNSYFEPASDVAVWAPRGGGKTRLAAVATLLDLLHKPGIGVRILGGSLEQSLRIWEHLLPDVERLMDGHFENPRRSRSIQLTNGSHAAAISQSQRAVRGLRIQRLRCDELELFDPDVLKAAMLTTRSIKDANGQPVAGTIEALSTMHTPWGLMHDLVERFRADGKKVIHWCVLDVLQTCPPDRPCEGCPLWDDCQGLAKNAGGFVPIDDAITLKQRSSVQSWESEMLCRRPSVQGAVFPTFDPDVHVSTTKAGAKKAGMALTLGIDFGFSNPFACLWISDDGKVVRVIDEYVQSGRTIEEHLEEIESRASGKVGLIACDPAGNSRNDQTADSNVRLLRRRGYRVKTRRSRIMDGLELIRRALKTGTGEVSLFIHPRCKRLIRAMRGYHYSPDRPSELPLKDGEHDHIIDALRYFFVNRSERDLPISSVY